MSSEFMPKDKLNQTIITQKNTLNYKLYNLVNKSIIFSIIKVFLMGFNPTKTKVQLKLALNRLSLLQQKKTVQNQNMRREIGQLLKQTKYESARVRVEHIIREDYLIEALELLHLYVDMLLARFGLTTLQYLSSNKGIRRWN